MLPPPRQPIALVLVVDDQTELRALTSSFLKLNGYDVIEAPDGRMAIAALCQHAPDLVILDLNMPVMDGWQFRAEQQRLANERLAEIPVLLLTGADGVQDHTASLKAVGFVQKPFDSKQLLEAVEEALAC